MGGTADLGSSGGGSGFAEALEAQRQRNDELQREIGLRQQLGSQFDQTETAIEKLRTQMDLESEAAKAGIELTPERRAAIEELAQGYAAASEEVRRLDEQQKAMQETPDDFEGRTSWAVSF